MKKITLSLLVTMFSIVLSAITYTRVKMVDGEIIEYFADKVAKFTYEIDTTTSNKYMYVNTTDGKVDKYNIKDVVEVAYENQAISGEKCGHEYVDLGLPSGMLWAVYNVGADSLGEVGDYFAWGETETKTDYSWSTYKWGTKDSLTKYNSADSLTALSAEDDAATANWGRAWRMPSMKELEELKNGCTWKWTTNFNESSVAGMVGTSKTNGNTIFLPLSFGYNGTDFITDKVIDGFVWSSDLSTVVNNNGNGYDNGKSILCGSGYYYKNSYTYLEIAHIYRCVGRCVRAVISGEDCVKSYNVNFLDIDGKIIDSQVVEEGKDAIAPDTPNVANYKFIGWDKEFTNVQSDLEVSAKYEKINIKCGHEYVDLGLPSGMLWAVYNVGADSLGEVGDYFAWGETEPKTDYSWSTYKWGTKDSLTKYNSADSLTALSAEDDAATANWGRAWRMPTMKELDELKNGCTWKWTTNFNESSVAGMVGTSKTNGNTIFLPLSFGYNGTDLTDKVIDGFVWSSDLSTVVNNNGNGYDSGKGVYSGSGYYYKNSYTYLEIAHIDRCVGRCVRAVVSGEDCVKTYNVKFLDIDGNLIESQIVEEGKDAIAPDSIPNVENYKFIGWDKEFTNVQSDLEVTAKYEKLNIKCGHEYVDLGLPSGMLWAVYNVGADSLGEVGDYFAWGETEPKADYSWSTYKWGSKDSLTKYNSTDSLTALSAEDDAATANWGRAWRTPSMKELDELKNGCTWKWTNNFNESSVAGMVGTSKTNGNTIFLPLSFGYNGTDLTDKVIDGFVWSSDLSTVVNNNGNGYDSGKGVYSGSGYYYKNSYTYLEIAHIDRCVGRCVRAVVSGEDCK